MTDSTLQAVLWDFDGTLAETEPLWIAAEFELVAELGGSWSLEHAEQLVGNDLIDSATYILNVIGRRDVEPAWVVQQMLARVVDRLKAGDAAWRPGALELLAEVNAAGIPCALVSASYRVLLDAALERLPAGSFRVSVAGDEVSRGKPHPEPYGRACELLGVDARHCVVLEDSSTGARAGNAAGAFVISVPYLVTVPAAPRRVGVASMTDLDVATVRRLLEQADGEA